MSEVRAALEAVHQRLTPPGDAFERFLAYDRRRQRRRRVAAGAVALVVAAAGAGFVLRAFATQDAPGPSETAGPTLRAANPKMAWTVPVGPTGQTSAILYAEGGLWVSVREETENVHVEDLLLVRLDPDTGREVARIEAPVPGWTFGGGGLAAGFGSVWVTGADPASPDAARATVHRIDPATNEVMARIPLDGRVGGDIAIGADAVWVAFSGRGSAEVARIDPTTNEVVATIALPSNYARSIVAAGDAVIVTELVWEKGGGPCAVLTSIDPQSNQVVARAPVERGCGAARTFAWEGDVWAATYGISRVDPHTAKPVGEQVRFDEGRLPRSFLLANDTEIWFAAYPGGNGTSPDTLARLNPATGRIEYFEGADPGGIAATLGPGAIWILDFDGSVTRIDLR
jgi:hypothetical protein